MKKLLLVLSLCLLIFPAHVYADDIKDTLLQVSPLKSTQFAQPGQTVTVPITVKNATRSMANIGVEVSDFGPSPNLDGQPNILEDANATYGLKGWFKGAASVSIPALSLTTYSAKFAIPKTAAERTYFASIIFNNPDAQSDDEKSLSIGSLIFINVGKPSADASIKSLVYNEPTADKPNGFFEAQIDNAGTGLYDVKMSLEIRGASLTTLQPDTAGSVLPESSRKYSFTPETSLPKEKLDVTLIATAENADPRSKKLSLDLSPKAAAAQTTPAPKKKSSPLLYVGVGLAALLILLGAVIFMRRKKKLPASSAPEQTPVLQTPPSDTAASSPTPPATQPAEPAGPDVPPAQDNDQPPSY